MRIEQLCCQYLLSHLAWSAYYAWVMSSSLVLLKGFEKQLQRY